MYMARLSTVCFSASILLLGFMALSQTRTTPKHQPVYTQDGQLRLPSDYREWVFLTSGFDMSYNPDMTMDHHMFDNVFVNPEAWKVFESTGTWPDKTVLVLELRRAEGKGSINQKGNFQTAEPMGIEVHVKDEFRFNGKWAFFGFSASDRSAKMTPLTQDCYSCHAEHGAVDTTFVQFYPTLMPIATRKGTLEAAYQKSEPGR
jgi:Cytochrome P460